MSTGQIMRRAIGTLLLVATVGLNTCQGAWYASLPQPPATPTAPDHG
jgi:hypothetical protein